VTAAAGPLGRVVESDGLAIKPRTGYQLGADANALIIMNRLAFADDRGLLDEKTRRPLLRWAAGGRLGQDDALVRDVAARRTRMLEDLRAAGQAVIRLRADPEWRLAVGLGNRANPHEIGLSLHGSYGWPIIPGSSLKGLTAAWAAASGAAAADIRRVLGSPRPPGKDGTPAGPARTGSPPGRADHRRGTVCFFDAIPADGPVAVAVDVLTPHVKPYYDSMAASSGRPAVPPAEYHNPVPVNFLTVSGAFAVDLYSPDEDDARLAASWLTAAGDELGVGAKTAAGYGYLTLTRLDDTQDRA
jgi:CRISPR/Cas system CMR subunit Cmr6 (Cas7 group RAMP superfamily)